MNTLKLFLLATLILSSLTYANVNEFNKVYKKVVIEKPILIKSFVNLA